MKGFLLRWLINAISLLAVVHIVAGVSVDRLLTTIIAALVIGLLNAFIRPLLLVLTLPVNVLTLGLFTLVINGCLFYLAAWLVKGFHVTGFWTAFIGALVFSIISWLLNLVIKSH
ncbi:MAG: phage holin family protein [Geobacteraceae bacterium]|nr:phage holin family protein [Geobacteraceae bacterium]